MNAGGVAFARHEHKISSPPDADPALERPKHHGSNKRQLVPVTGCVPRHIADQLERMRDQHSKDKDKKKRLSRSSVVGSILAKSVQTTVDMQYGAMLEPIIERTIDKKFEGHTNRCANLAREAFYAAETARLLQIRELHLLLSAMGKTDDLEAIIDECQKEALKNLRPYYHFADGGEGADAPWPSSSSNTYATGLS